MTNLLRTAFLAALLTGVAIFDVNAQAVSRFAGYPSAKWPSNPSPGPEDYKLSHDDFVTRYGINDTAAAIVHMYLRKHMAGLRTTQIVGGLTSAAGYLASAQADVAASNAGQQVDPTNRNYPSWVTPVLLVGGSGTLWGLVQATVWSRRACYQTLFRYHTTHQLPPKVRHRLTRFLIKTQNREFND